MGDEIEPTDETINKAIAEYMSGEYSLEPGSVNKSYGYVDEDNLIYPITFTESLDALVPVVEKLGHQMEIVYSDNFKIWAANIYIPVPETRKWEENIVYNNESPSQALARACYEVIKNLDSEPPNPVHE